MIKNMIGLTLLECMIAIAISAILLFSVIFGYQTFFRKNQINSLVDQLVDTLEYARNVAVTTQSTIVFCPSQKNRDKKCGSNWQNTELILNKASGKILRVIPAVPNQYHLYWRSTLGESGSLEWRADGFTRGQQGSFLICTNQTDSTVLAKIIILRTGRLRVVDR